MGTWLSIIVFEVKLTQSIKIPKSSVRLKIQLKHSFQCWNIFKWQPNLILSLLDHVRLLVNKRHFRGQCHEVLSWNYLAWLSLTLAILDKQYHKAGCEPPLKPGFSYYTISVLTWSRRNCEIENEQLAMVENNRTRIHRKTLQIIFKHTRKANQCMFSFVW